MANQLPRNAVIRTAGDVLDLIRHDPWMMGVLAAVRDLELPDGWIGAGFVRARVWDALHGFETTPPADVDVLYFDPMERSERQEKRLEGRLAEQRPDVPWSVKNQARMHLKNGDPPYRSTPDALRYWLETPTCVAVALAADGGLRLTAPYGLGDLLAMRIRPTPAGRRRHDAYLERLRGKDWLRRWPRVRAEPADLRASPA